MLFRSVSQSRYYIRYIEEGIVNPNEKEILVSKIHFSTNMIAITLETVDSLNHRWIAALNNKPIPFEAANLYMLS